MSDKTKIEWADATWNPITGCSVVSKGCRNCRAMRLAGSQIAEPVDNRVPCYFTSTIGDGAIMPAGQ